MKAILIIVGKTREPYIQAGVDEYVRRIGRYMPFRVEVAPEERGSVGALRLLRENDYVVLLDERGREYRSVEFAEWLNRMQGMSARRLAFVIGGAYGFSEEMYERADEKISLSKLTFSHELARLVFAEQLYRACTILRHEPYHHE